MTTDKEVVLQVRMSAALHEKAKEKAKAAGLALSDWIRSVIDPSTPTKSTPGRLKHISLDEPMVSAYTPPAKPTAGKVCSVCGTQTEHYAYDRNQQVRCQNCAA